MRVDQRGIYHESGLRLDFTAAKNSLIHDSESPEDGNTFWDGVDFRVSEENEEIWIEVKSWSFKSIRDSIQRRSAKKDYTEKLREKKATEFRDKIYTKFLGTSAYLAWSKKGIPDKVIYIVFLEPPDRGSRPLLAPFQDKLRDKFKQMPTDLQQRIRFRVVDLAEFQKLFPQYPVSII